MALILFVSLFIMLFLTIPIALTLAASSALVFTLQYPELNMTNLLGQAIVTTADSFPLMAIPFFMLVGTLMSRAGLAKEIVEVGEAVAGSTPGGLGSATIIACMIFAAISGSGPAVVAALGTILVPAMIERGYDRAYAGAVVATGATIGPVIPPSIPMIVYGVTAGVSAVTLFAAGVLPGILMGVALIIMNYIISKKRGYKGKARGGGFLWVLKTCWRARWALILPLIILGGIYGGVFTATEAAVIGCAYALAVGKFAYKSLTAAKIKDAMVEAGLLSCVAMFVLGGATTFGRLLTLEGIPRLIAKAMLSLTDSSFIIMLLIMGFLLITGMFIDTTSNIVLFTPLFLPIVLSLGYDPVFFGVIMTINLCIGFCTPPVGVNLNVAQGVCKAPFEKVSLECIPFLAVLVAVLFVLLMYPDIVLVVPRLLGFI